MNDGVEATKARALREAVRVAPDDASLRGLLADALEAAGDAAGAEHELKQAARLAPGEVEPRLALGRFYARRGRSNVALVVVEDVLAETPDHGAALTLRRQLRAAVGEQDPPPPPAPPAAPVVADAARVGDARPGETAFAEARAGGYEDAAVDDEGVPVIARHPGQRPRAGITFADVGGMEAVKEEIRLKIILPLTHPELYAAYGKQAGGAILMYGPPGCGKTHLARATAGEVDAAFIAVGISDVLDMWIGNSEKNLHALFEQARASAPCVLFFDEVDALAAKRGDLGASAGRQLVNQFLHELDGATRSNEGVLVVAATNAPWHLDDAFRRPGRFDRLLFVPPPDGAAREAILRLQLRGRPAEGVDAAAVAAKTAGYSGADLMGLVDRAVERKLPEALRLGRPVPIGTRDLLSLLGDVKPSTRDWFNTARNYVLYANQGGQYDAVRAYLDAR